MAHRIQRLGLGIGEAQPRRDAFGILGDGNRERAEPSDRVGFKSQQMFRRYHRRKGPGVGDAAEDRQQQAAVGHRRDRDLGSLGDHELEHLHANAFRRKIRQSRASANAGEISGAIGFSGRISGVKAEEPEDA